MPFINLTPHTQWWSIYSTYLDEQVSPFQFIDRNLAESFKVKLKHADDQNLIKNGEINMDSVPDHYTIHDILIDLPEYHEYLADQDSWVIHQKTYQELNQTNQLKDQTLIFDPHDRRIARYLKQRQLDQPIN